jgi:hypothetical protein
MTLNSKMKNFLNKLNIIFWRKIYLISLLFFFFMLTFSFYLYWKFYLKIEAKPIGEKITMVNKKLIDSYSQSQNKKVEAKNKVKELKYPDLFLRPDGFPTSTLEQ